MTDIVTAIDTAIANELHAGYQMDRCSQCDTALNGSVSYYWCSPSCQEDWQAAQADEEMPDSGRGFDEEAAPFPGRIVVRPGRARRASLTPPPRIEDFNGRWETFGNISVPLSAPSLTVWADTYRLDVRGYEMPQPEPPRCAADGCDRDAPFRVLAPQEVRDLSDEPPWYIRMCEQHADEARQRAIDRANPRIVW